MRVLPGKTLRLRQTRYAQKRGVAGRIRPASPPQDRFQALQPVQSLGEVWRHGSGVLEVQTLSGKASELRQLLAGGALGGEIHQGGIQPDPGAP